MSNLVTIKHLQAIVDRINSMTNSPMHPYVKREDGSAYDAQIGNYHLSHEYGGVALHRMSNYSGGVTNVLMSGHVPKRELQTAMFAFIRGFEEAQS